MEIPKEVLDTDANPRDLFDPKDSELKTDLDEKKIQTCHKLDYLGEQFAFTPMKAFLEKYYRLRFSFLRRSRQEYSDTFKSNRDTVEMNKQGSFRTGLFG